MCGISGVFLKEGEKADVEELRRMAATMLRRGPDAEGAFVHENVGLAHRRLKIIDLSAIANQPLFNEDGKIGVVFNGEIYNFLELRKELEKAGHIFRSSSDTEVIVHGFEEWGEKLFFRLNGMFAFGLWDGRGTSQAIYLVRDRFGIKPLFYTLQRGRLAFASELKPLFQVSWIHPELDPEALFYFLKFSHVPGEKSILKDIKQLKPGRWLRFEDGKVHEGVFWDPTDISRHPVSVSLSAKISESSEERYIAELEEILIRAVRRQIVSDVPFGCFLSGGIDSSLLVMAHAALGIGRLKTFTICYRESEFDESVYAKEVARYFYTEHHEWIAQPKDLIELIPDLPEYFDQPFADPSLLPTLLLCRFAREKVTVALSGDGGDELFFGYTQHRALLLMQFLTFLPVYLRKPFLEGVRYFLSPLVPKIGKLAEILQFNDEAELMQYFVGTIGPMRMDRLSQLLLWKKPDPWRPLFWDHLDLLRELEWPEKIVQIFVRTFLVDTVLTKTDRAGMAFGLEARVPFLDNEMVDFAARLPFHMKYRRGTLKYISRQLLQKKLPGSLSQRKKQGFSVPLREWFRHDLKYLLDEYLNSVRLKREGIFDPETVKEVVRWHLNGRANHSHLLWSLVSFQMWKERYLP